MIATSGPARSDYLPDVPSFVEQGRPDLVVREWFAYFAPGRMAPSLVGSAASELRDAIARPAVAATFSQAGMTPVSSAPAVLAARIAVEQRHWREVIRANDIRAD